MRNTGATHGLRGFSLVEVTLAIGIAAFCLLALFGLLPIGVSSNQTSIEQTAAASVAASIVADLRAAPVVAAPVVAASSPAPSASPPTSKQFAIPVPPKTGQVYTLFLREDGSMAQASGALPTDAGWDANLAQNPRYRVTLVFNPPAAGQLSATPVRVLVTWPATSDPKKAKSLLPSDDFPSRFSGSFEVVTALDRY